MYIADHPVHIKLQYPVPIKLDTTRFKIVTITLWLVFPVYIEKMVDDRGI